MANETTRQEFVVYLESMREDRAVMAVLRRGLGQPPGGAPEMFRYVVPFVHQTTGAWQEEVYYMIASLFGYHPESAATGNMGSHLGLLRQKNLDSPAIERRFTTLMAAHPDDLAFHLRQVISLLKSKDVAVNWHQLFQDTLRWNNPDTRAWVCKQWAGQFWK